MTVSRTMFAPSTLAAAPTDQAAGLRRLFGERATCFVPLVSNPHVGFGGVLIDRLVTAFAEAGRATLVVDAAERSPAAAELTAIDLGQGIERLGPHLSYLAARGLPSRYVDAQGGTASFLDALADAAPQAQVVLVHATAPDLTRLFARRPVRPIVLACDHPAAVTHAYAGIKLLTQRAGLLAHALLLGAASHSPRIERIARHVASCADLFLGAVLSDWAVVDPAADVAELPGAALRRLARAALAGVPAARAQDAPAPPTVSPHAIRPPYATVN